MGRTFFSIPRAGNSLNARYDHEAARGGHRGWRHSRIGCGRHTIMAVALTPGPPSAASEDRPRTIVAPVSAGDQIFRGILRGAGFTVFLITGLILVFLIIRSVSALHAVGFRFFTTSTWFISTNQFGIAAILPLGILAALIALLIAVPVGVATALFISEYARPWLRRTLITLIDLMAAVAGIIIALLAVYVLMPRILRH